MTVIGYLNYGVAHKRHGKAPAEDDPIVAGFTFRPEADVFVADREDIYYVVPLAQGRVDTTPAEQ